MARVSDLFESWGGATPSTSEPTFWGGDIPWISSKDIKHPRISKGTEFLTEAALRETRVRICPRGSVLVVIRSGILAHSLPVAVTEAEVVINQDLKAFYCGEPSLNDWLALALQAKAGEILAASRKDGTTVQSIRYDQLKNLELPIPPQAEQLRIMARSCRLIESVNRIRQRLAKVPATLKRFRQAVLAAACSGRLTGVWREVNESDESAQCLIQRMRNAKKTGHAKPNPDAEMELPASWEMASIDEITSIITSGSRDWKKYYADDGPGTFVMAQNIRPMALDRSYRLAVCPPENDRDRMRSQVRRADLLVTIVGANTGDVCRVREDLEQHYVCQSVALMRPTLPETSAYIELFLNSPLHGKAQFDNWIYGEGRPHISFDHLRATAIALPPLAEQHEIVCRVEALLRLADAIERRVAAATARAEKLTQAILAKAFRGELVPTEAELARSEGREYEPATLLLEAIRRASKTDGNGETRSARIEWRAGKASLRKSR